MAKICQLNHFIKSQETESRSQSLKQHDSELPQTIDSSDDCPETEAIVRDDVSYLKNGSESRTAPCFVRGEKIE